MKPIALVACVALALGAAAIRADTLVCKQGRTVQPGMTPDEVKEKCGPPTSIAVRKEELRAVNAAGASFKHGEILVETWRYERGSQKPAAVLEIRDGKVKSIVFEK
jgi:hypothetical protein